MTKLKGNAIIKKNPLHTELFYVNLVFLLRCVICGEQQPSQICCWWNWNDVNIGVFFGVECIYVSMLIYLKRLLNIKDSLVICQRCKEHPWKQQRQNSIESKVCFEKSACVFYGNYISTIWTDNETGERLYFVNERSEKRKKKHCLWRQPDNIPLGPRRPINQNREHQRNNEKAKKNLAVGST